MKQKLNCVLLVDDDPATNFLNRKLIEKADITDHIEVVLNGQEAIDYLTNQGRYEQTGDDFPQPQLLFLDINMPVMDGWEFLAQYEKLNANQKCDIVIMMLTTSQNPDDEMKARTKSLVAGFQQKPMSLKMIEDIVQTHFPQNV